MLKIIFIGTPTVTSKINEKNVYISFLICQKTNPIIFWWIRAGFVVLFGRQIK
jgi:hypothetical protein